MCHPLFIYQKDLNRVDLIKEQPTVWQALQESKKPIVLYGMGDGAEKILRVFAQKGIQASDIFASDEFVRGHTFAGFRVKRLAEIVELYKDFIIVVCFAVHDDVMLKRLYDLDSQYELYAPDVPVAGEGVFDDSYYSAHEDEFCKAYEFLQNDYSRQVFANIIKFKLSGKIGYLKACTTPKSQAYHQIIKPHQNEHYVDLGAYDGDTIREVLSYTDGRFARITAFEPDAKNYRKLQAKLEQNLSRQDLKKVFCYNLLAHKERNTLYFASRAGRNSSLSNKNTTRTISMEADSVDNVLRGCDIPATIIKLDVEGAEHDALLGCAITIKQHGPRLIVSAYHRNEDLFDLPLLIKQLNPAYKLYLRRHPYIPAWDINLYATTEI